MRVLIQRVSKAEVIIGGEEKAAIGLGMMILLGIESDDTMLDIEWLCSKISRLRIFPDDQGVMNCSVLEVKGELMVVSQFTLHASTKKGNRPSYIRAARPETAIPLYESFITRLGEEMGQEIKTGEFGAMMDIHLVNSGPVSIWIDSKNKE